MKFAVLTYIADSLAGGVGLMIGVYDIDVFGEAAKSAEGFIEVDFLAGKSSGGQALPSLTRAVELYAGALEALCVRHGATPSDFRTLTARYSGGPASGRFVVDIEDQAGRRSRDEYVGRPGARPKLIDPLGRVRRSRSA